MTQLQDAPVSVEWSSEDVGNIIALEHVNTCCCRSDPDDGVLHHGDGLHP